MLSHFSVNFVPLYIFLTPYCSEPESMKRVTKFISIYRIGPFPLHVFSNYRSMKLRR